MQAERKMPISDDHQVPPDPVPADEPTPDQNPTPDEDPVPDHNPVAIERKRKNLPEELLARARR
jgi:hypothetical protein